MKEEKEQLYSKSFENVISSSKISQSDFNLDSNSKPSLKSSILTFLQHNDSQQHFSSDNFSPISKNVSFNNTIKQSSKLSVIKNDKLTTKTYLQPNFFSILEFHIAIKEKQHNQLEIQLPHYQIKYWQPLFRQTSIHYFVNQYHKNKKIGLLRINCIQFQMNTKQFILNEETIIKSKEFHFQFKDECQQKGHYSGKFVAKIGRKIIDCFELKENRKKILTKYPQLEEFSKQQKRPLRRSRIFTNIKQLVKASDDIKERLTTIRLKVIGLKYNCRFLQNLLTQLKTYQKQLSQRPQVIMQMQYEKITRMRMRNQFKSNDTLSQKSNSNFHLINRVREKIKQGNELFQFFCKEIKNFNVTLGRKRNVTQQQLEQLMNYCDIIMQGIILSCKVIKQHMQIVNKKTNCYINFLLTLDEVIFFIYTLPPTFNPTELDEYLDYLFYDQHETILFLKKIVQLIQNKQQQHQYRVISRETIEKEVKNIFEMMILQNYIMLCYQFKNKVPMYLSQFRLDDKLDNYSMMTKKTQFFWRNYNQPMHLKRLYYDFTENFNQLKELSTAFEFMSIYRYYADKPWISQMVRYLIHMNQFILQILCQLTQGSSITLSVVFNASRYLISYLIIHLWIQLMLKIKKQIKQQNGDFYYNVFLQILQQSNRWLNSKNKISSIFRLIYQKLVGYSQNSKSMQVGKKKPINNPEKFATLMHENVRLRNLFERLQKRSGDDICNRLIKDKYDFTEVKEIYTSIIQLIISDYANKNNLKKLFEKRVLNIKQQQIKQVKKYCLHKKNYQDYIHFVNKQKKYLNLENFAINNRKDIENREEYQLISQRFIIYFLEIVKLLSMILMIPYYSFQTQVENIKFKHMSKQQYKSNESVFCRVDELYIYDGTRMNNDYFFLIIYQLKAQKFFTQYADSIFFILQFLLKDTWQEKLNKLCKIPQQIGQNTIFKHPQYIHSDRFSIFSLQECKQFFLKIFIQDTVDKDVLQQIQELSEFAFKFKEKGRNLLGNFAKTASGIASTESNFVARQNKESATNFYKMNKQL